MSLWAGKNAYLCGEVSAEELVDQISERLALAMENARLYEEAKIRSEELNLLNKVTSTLSASLDLQENLNFIAETLVHVLPIQHTTLRLLNEEKTFLLSTIEHGIDDSSIDSNPSPVAENSIYNQVITTRQSIQVEDITDQTIPLSMRKTLETIGTKSLLVLPLLVGDEVIGIIGLHSTDPGKGMLPQEIQLAKTIVSQAATAVQNARLFERQQRRAIQLQTGAEVSQAASSYLNLDELLPQTVKLIQEGFNLAGYLLLKVQSGEMS